ncbi:hypothetical protein [Breoghania sp.]|uniref:hypothetical protein n=1 Tax=Breoghania sp. TaxID=2065378 RepID=UPI00261028B2|nr:hypothetical protein [Breoghania sp.]
MRLRYVFYTFRCAPQARRDAIIIALASIPVLILAIHYDIFDLLFEYTGSHEAWELDELLSAGFVVGLASIIYAVRRLTDLKVEVRSRRDAENVAVRLTLHDPLTGLPNRHKFEQLF